MPFECYLIDYFDYTHENLIFRDLQIQLENKFNDKEELVVLVGNIKIRNANLDAMLLKNGFWAIIDFKDYGGDLTISEFSLWKIGEIEVRGGSKANPYLQVNSYRKEIINYFNLELSSYFKKKNNPINITHLSCIVLFHKPIKIVSGDLKHLRYLFIYDFKNFVSHIDAFRNSKMNIGNKDIKHILLKLNINKNELAEKKYKNLKFEKDIKNDYPEIKYINDKSEESISDKEKRQFYYSYNYEDEILDKKVIVEEVDQPRRIKKNKYKYILLLLLPLTFLVFLNFFYNEDRSNLSGQINANNFAIYMNDNFQKSDLAQILRYSNIRLVTKDTTLNLNSDNIHILSSFKNIQAEGNLNTLRIFFEEATSNNYDSIFIIGDLGNLKNKKINPKNKYDNILVKKEFWDSLKARNTYFKILSNNKSSNLKTLIENRHNEVFNN